MLQPLFTKAYGRQSFTNTLFSLKIKLKNRSPRNTYAKPNTNQNSLRHPLPTQKEETGSDLTSPTQPVLQSGVKLLFFLALTVLDQKIRTVRGMIPKIPLILEREDMFKQLLAKRNPRNTSNVK